MYAKTRQLSTMSWLDNIEESTIQLLLLLFCYKVWSEDSWLQEHAGATLNSKTDKSTEADDTGTKRPAEDTESVCSQYENTVFRIQNIVQYLAPVHHECSEMENIKLVFLK